MKKYIVHRTDYCGEDPEMFSIEARDDNDAILMAFQIDKVDIDLEYDGLSEKQIVNILNDENGDGQPYVTVFSIEEDKVIFGEV